MGQILLSGVSILIPKEGESLPTCRKESEHMPELETKGNFIRDGITLHRDTVSSQKQRMRESPGA